jgi:CubicO group peptidase (beta-lactamase class C family)
MVHLRKTTVGSFMARYIIRKIFMRKPASFADIGLFTGAQQHGHLMRLDELAPVSRMPASKIPHPLHVGPLIDIPPSYSFAGSVRSTEDFLVDTDTSALLVLVDGVVRYERYLLTGGPRVNWLSMSVAKSVISALVGIAVDEGHIRSIDELISDYVPVDPGSAYDGVSIQNVLHMSSGALWNEDYNDPKSDIHQVTAAMLGSRGGLNGFVARMVKESDPDTICRYNSGDTQVLGALIARATGRTVSDYMTEKLIEPLGFESPSYWVTDMRGTEMVYAGLNLIARDYAKFGELYRNNGIGPDGRRILSTKWIEASTSIDSPVRTPGRPIVGDHAFELGYGYQWWIPAGGQGDYCAIGVLNQLIYVNPSKAVTIVKLSANRLYGTSTGESTNRDLENVEFLRGIAASV